MGCWEQGLGKKKKTEGVHAFFSPFPVMQTTAENYALLEQDVVITINDEEATDAINLRSCLKKHPTDFSRRKSVQYDDPKMIPMKDFAVNHVKWVDWSGKAKSVVTKVEYVPRNWDRSQISTPYRDSMILRQRIVVGVVCGLMVGLVVVFVV